MLQPHFGKLKTLKIRSLTPAYSRRRGETIRIRVPIIYEGQTIGVIDSEHSEPHLYQGPPVLHRIDSKHIASKLAECLITATRVQTKALVASQKNIEQQSVELLSQRSADPLRSKILEAREP